jgi:hypothetical protein
VTPDAMVLVFVLPSLDAHQPPRFADLAKIRRVFMYLPKISMRRMLPTSKLAITKKPVGKLFIDVVRGLAYW